MQPSLHRQLLNLNLKMDSGLQAIDQLSQLLIFLIQELRDVQNPERSATRSALDSALPELLLSQLSSIRQGLGQSHLSLGEEALSAAVPQTRSRQGEASLIGNATHPDYPERVSLHHKDVLEDEDSFGFEDTVHSSLSADMQVRRLMAQLTAAYNRIAALEEQLLFSHRPSYASQD